MSSRSWWMLRAFGPAVLFMISAVLSLLARDWGQAATTGACALVLALAAQVQRYAYRAGFWAGVLDLTSAIQTGDSPILRGTKPEPWDKLPGGKGDDAV